MIPRSLVFLILTSSLYLNSQNTNIKGVVLDGYNNPLANVTVKGSKSNLEILTDSIGFYNIVAANKEKLIFSLYGYKSQRKAIKDKDIVNVSMTIDHKQHKQLEENYVNTGYGIIKESESTSSGNSVNQKLIKKDSNIDIATYLRSVSGVRVMEVNGELSILIRGVHSMSSSDAPLIVLNGSQFFGSLRSLNPNDIKSIDVLKDASETSIYGIKGANGVISIVTNTN